MRKTFALGVLLFWAAAASAETLVTDYQIVRVSVANVWVPQNFDDNDEAQVIIDGYLPDSCHRIAKPRVQFSPGKRTVHIQAQARKFSNETLRCEASKIPFYQEVNLGMLTAGTYSVRAVGSPSGKTMPVRVSGNVGPDDFLYAPVDSVEVRYPFAPTGDLVAVVSGRFTNSCMAMEKVQVVNTGDVIEMLPVMRVLQTAPCLEVEKAYTEAVLLPSNLAVGRHLLHVRSLNGKAANLLFNVYPAL